MEKREVTLEVENITLKGQLLLPSDDAGQRVLCICHGIPSGKPADPGDGGYPALAGEFAAAGLAVMIFNFRGTGESGGNIDLAGWKHDLSAVVDYLHQLPEAGRLYLMGFSGGAAVCVCVGAEDARISGVIACACPAEFGTLTDPERPAELVRHFREIGAIRDDGYPASAAAWYERFVAVKPIDCVGKVAPRPLLLVHGDRDETVDISHARRLYENAADPKELVVIEGAGHRLRQEKRAMMAVKRWMDGAS